MKEIALYNYKLVYCVCDRVGAGNYQWYLSAVIVLYPFRHVIGLILIPILIIRSCASGSDDLDLLIYMCTCNVYFQVV